MGRVYESESFIPHQTEEPFTISSVKWKGHLKQLTLQPGDQKLIVPLSACATIHEKIQITNGDAWVLCKNGKVQILRPYAEKETLRLGGLRLGILVKEVTEQEEHQACGALAKFHYRGRLIHGRTARLIARTSHPTYPKVIGYVELATPFYMNKPRARILDAPFRMNGISWESWNMPTLRRYIHLVVRVARCVVYPEFRGLGLGQILLKHAAQFARRRWQVSRLAPYFLEISADMLKYVPFAEKAGMVFIGETEGNLARVHKDMEYLIRNVHRVNGGEIVSEDSCGIVDQQVTRMRKAIRLMEKEKLTIEELIKRLRSLSRDAVLRDFTLFHGIVSLPKPTYLKGLYPHSSRFIRKRAAEIVPSNGRAGLAILTQPLGRPIRFRDITATFISRVRRTRSTHTVQQAFDISPDDIRSTVINGLSLEINPGEVMLVVGPSGSGKTTLLRFFEPKSRDKSDMEINGDIEIPENYLVGSFQAIRSRRPLIELFDKKDVSSTLQVLGLAGLSEPALYLKRFDELSKGQQYRAMLAKMIVSQTNVWIADEFCVNLDSATANAVAHNVQKTARQFGITVIVAAPHSENFLFALKPDKVLALTSAWEYRLLDGKEYEKSVNRARNWDGSFPHLRLLPKFFESIRSGQKRSTIRLGQKWFQPGLLLLECDAESLPVNVVQVEHRKFSGLTEEDAREDGFERLNSLKEALRSIYPNIRESSFLTIIHFSPLGTIQR